MEKRSVENRKQSQWRIHTEITGRGGRRGKETGRKKAKRDGRTTEKWWRVGKKAKP